VKEEGENPRMEEVEDSQNPGIAYVGIKPSYSLMQSPVLRCKPYSVAYGRKPCTIQTHSNAFGILQKVFLLHEFSYKKGRIVKCVKKASFCRNAGSFELKNLSCNTL
jgi:hypothetical protein